MSASLRISLEQWQALRAVVEHGGYARAAEALHKSQSTLTYSIQKIQSLLGVQAFSIEGRRAMLTPAGRLLYQRARVLLEEAAGLERSARALSAGWEAEIRLAAEIIFPTWLLLDCLHRFGAESPHTRIELIESVIRGTTEALTQGSADLVIANAIPAGFLGDPLMHLKFLAVAHPDHPLHKAGRTLTHADLRAHRHIVVRDTASTRAKDAVAVSATQRWTVSNMATSIEAVRMGMGFAWFPVDRIRSELERGMLAPLPLREGVERQVTLYLVYADREMAGPGTLRLGEIIREAVERSCPQEAARDRGLAPAANPPATKLRPVTRAPRGRRRKA